MVFSNNMPTRLDFRVAVEDRFAQKSIDVYRGFAQLYTAAAAAAAAHARQFPPTAAQSADDYSRRRSVVNNKVVS